MKLKHERLYLKSAYTIGVLYVDGRYLCNTLEDRVLDLSCEKRVLGKTAIPAGVL